jgi:caa(3)-type oxidase subunit IV
MSDSPEEIQKHVKTYMKVGILLIVMTVVTVLLSFVDFGSHSNNMLIGMAVAAFKSTFVGLIFMHLNHERPLIYKFLVFATVFVSVMFILFTLTHDDGLHMPGFEAHKSARF